MARKPRVEFEGALYHVIVGGNHRRDIFRDRRDRLAYRDRALQRALSLHWVCLRVISDHVHLLIETGRWGFPRSCRRSSSAIHSAIIAVTVPNAPERGQAGVVDLINIERSSCESVCDRRKTLTENSQ